MPSPLSRLATEVLAQEEPVLSQPSREADARAILALEGAILGVARRRRFERRALAGALAVAAAIALGVGWHVVGASTRAEDARALRVSAPSTPAPARASSLTEGAIIVRGERGTALSDSVELEPRDRIVTPEAGRAAITFASGTHLVVAASSALTLAEQGATTALVLTKGSVHADVAKLHAGERFVVRTPDGEVEVRGTSFDVSVAAPSASCGGGTTTRVGVSEGVVVVRSAGLEDRVGKGESWPRGCAVAVAAAESFPAPASASASSAARATTVAPSLAPLAVAPPLPRAPLPGPLPASPSAGAPVAGASSAGAPVAASSDLAAQNALFAEASAARRRGDTAAALAAYDRLTASYPSSPLAESAYVERMRLLAAANPRRGAEAARLYLARYPHGFARSEADDLLARQP